MSEQKRPSADELLEALNVKAIRALRRAGFGLPRLREMARGKDGDDRVHAIVSEFTTDDAERMVETTWPPDRVPRRADRTPLTRRVVRRWSLVLLFDIAAAALCWLLTLAGSRQSTLAALVALLMLHGVWVMRAMPDSPGRKVAGFLAWIGLPVLLLGVVHGSPRAYLDIWGREGTASAYSLTWTRSNGVASPTCYVRLPDGQVKELRTDSRTCKSLDTAAAEPIQVVYDPSEGVLPVSGTKANLGIGQDVGFAMGGLLLVVLAAGTAVLRTALAARG
ncbi:hypothetical protein [Streptantibioticus ferralitis]|uniref:DUF3592 domain-containing protein n=1 Tax=Streptantibioticus ferralitis TaxID=236510 RepID=A0ABT5Z7N0_9ACTN|nr:hypothetical protein [Streptantibioticus ferralitis]MDF2259841.1 hypothetical protein [Streptantibioticus ferralitis]